MNLSHIFRDQAKKASMNREVDRLTLAWWNTGLNPPRAKDKRKRGRLVYKTIEKLCSISDVIFLGEFLVRNQLLKIMLKINRDYARQFQVYKVPDPKLDRAFRIACLYDASKLSECPTLKASSFLDLIMDINDDDKPENYYRVGRRYPFLSSFFNKDVFNCFAVHWGSYAEVDSEEAKIMAACQLRRQLDPDAFTVCVGDFNQEPHGHALAALGTSRSKKFVEKYGGMYNPFWQNLCEDNGTLNYTNRRMLRTFMPVFDQIMVSRKILCGGGIRMFHEVLGDDYFMPKPGDHRPIKLVLSRSK